MNYTIIKENNTWSNSPGFPHQVEAMEDDSILIEVSTPDYDYDSYRVMPGDGQ